MPKKLPLLVSILLAHTLFAADQAPLTSAALEEPSPAREKLFERLRPVQTGIDFRHRWAPPVGLEEMISGSFTGGGVAIGDYDGDARPDIFFTSPDGGGRLYRNLGGFKFEDVSVESRVAIRGGWSAGATWADVDGDGRLDLFVCMFGGPNRLYFNEGDGTFLEGATKCGITFSGASIMAAFGDYDRDGDLDLYLLTNRAPPPPGLLNEPFSVTSGPDGEPILPDRFAQYAGLVKMPGGKYKQVAAAQFDFLYRNDGPGTNGLPKFTDVSKQAGIWKTGYGLSATWWDYDGDGWQDLYVANDFYSPDHLYRNNRDGTFTDMAPVALPHTPWFSMGSDVGDINNDGLFDYMAADMAGSDHYKEKMSMGNMTGKESDSWFLNFPTPPQYMRNAVYLNTGTGRFMEVAHLAGLATTDWTWSVKFGDFDCDGREDVFVSSGMSRDWFNSDLRNIEESLITDAGKKAANAFWEKQKPLALKNWAFRNRGDLRFENVSATWGIDDVDVSYGAALSDLDGDGDLDLVVNNFEAEPAVYRNSTAKRGRIVIRLVGKSNRFGIGARVRIETTGEPGLQARCLTLSRGFMSSNEPLLHFGLGEQEKVNRLLIDWPSGGQQVVTNLAVGRRYTIREVPARVEVAKKVSSMFKPSRRFRGAVATESKFDDFAAQPLLPYRLSQLGPGIACADVNDDGKDELYLGGPAGHAGQIVGKQVFQADARCEDMAPLFFDFDADGDLDLYIVSGGVECVPGDPLLRDRLYLNDDKGKFTRAADGTLPDLRESGSVVCAADYDRDGDLDLFVGGRVIPGRYPESPTSYLLRNEAGHKFVVDLAAPRFSGMVTSAMWSDVNADGWIDLLVTHEWGPVKLYLNDGARLIAGSALTGIGWWNSVAGGDLDHDGDIDFVVGNVGLNTKYKTPAVLIYGNVDGTGKKRIIEAAFEGETCFPIRGLSCSSHAMPYLKQKTPKFHDFASATLTDLYKNLDTSLRLEANAFESGLLINDGSGRFAFKPLPRVAQAAPVFGIAVADIDADGHLDLYLSQNFYAPQNETGRFDGGVSLLLRGTGGGEFTPVWPDESGLVIGADARGIAVTDLNADGRPDFVVAVNDGELRAFENAAPQSGQRLSVILRSARPTIGARVEFSLKDGSRVVSETFSGGGYLSQSSRKPNWIAGSVKSIRVRWPNGESSKHAIEPNAKSVVIEQPE